MAESWELLRDGAVHLAYQRLQGLHSVATGAVNSFHRDAYAQIETLRGSAPSALGGELFKTLTNIVWICFPEGALLEKIADEAFKAARDGAVSTLQSYAAQSSDQRAEGARDELRAKLNDMTAANDAAFKAAWIQGNAKAPEALATFFQQHPQYRNLPYDSNAIHMQGWLCDQIGIRDFAIVDPTAKILEELWAAFAKEVGRASAKLKFFDMDNDVERLVYLLEKVAPTTDVATFLQRIGADVRYWQTLIQMYREEHPGTDVNVMAAQAILMEYARTH